MPYDAAVAHRLPHPITYAMSAGGQEAERAVRKLARVLERHAGAIGPASSELGVHRTTLEAWMAKWAIPHKTKREMITLRDYANALRIAQGGHGARVLEKTSREEFRATIDEVSGDLDEVAKRYAASRRTINRWCVRFGLGEHAARLRERQ